MKKYKYIFKLWPNKRYTDITDNTLNYKTIQYKLRTRTFPLKEVLPKGKINLNQKDLICEHKMVI
jgi:hypothetical protein